VKTQVNKQRANERSRLDSGYQMIYTRWAILRDPSKFFHR